MNLLFSCIGRRGYIADYMRHHLNSNDKIVGTSNSMWTAGFKDVDLPVVLPDIASSEYIPTLLNLCKQQEIDALLSFFDPDVDKLSRHLDDFRALGIKPIIPSFEVSDICFDKNHTFQFLRDQGFNTPLTYVDIDEAFRAIRNATLKYPVIVKPRRGFGSQNLYSANNQKELEVFFHIAPDMVIQEKLVGDQYDYDLITDFQGQVLAVVPWQKLSSRAGEVDRAVTSNEPRLMDLGVKLGQTLGDLGHVGPLDADLFVQEDRIYILEMNPRFGGGYPISHIAGADFPSLIVKMIRGEEVTPEIGNFRPGSIMMKEYNIFGGNPDDYFSKVINMR
jgi:carbamoyl-phosphate synthase large subunit